MAEEKKRGNPNFGKKKETTVEEQNPVVEEPEQVVEETSEPISSKSQREQALELVTGSLGTELVRRGNTAKRVVQVVLHKVGINTHTPKFAEDFKVFLQKHVDMRKDPIALVKAWKF